MRLQLTPRSVQKRPGNGLTAGRASSELSNARPTSFCCAVSLLCNMQGLHDLSHLQVCSKAEMVLQKMPRFRFVCNFAYGVCCGKNT